MNLGCLNKVIDTVETESTGKVEKRRTRGKNSSIGGEAKQRTLVKHNFPIVPWSEYFQGRRFSELCMIY